MARRVSNGRIAAIMKSAVSDQIEDWKEVANKPSKAGSYSENYVAGSPKAKWRRKIWKYGPIEAGTEATYTLTGAISGSTDGHVEVQAITIMLTSSLSGATTTPGLASPAVYIGAIGLGSPVIDADYFYTASVSDPAFISGSGAAILAHPARGGTHLYTAANLINGGYHTASTDVTITYNVAPSSSVGEYYVFIYGDKFMKSYE